jgi:hypothetical protein
MDITTVLTQILGIIFLVLGVSMFINSRNEVSVLGSIDSNKGLMWAYGFIALTMGATIIALNNIWTSGWPLVITIIGWLCLLKGVCILVFPQSMVSIYKKWNKPGLIGFTGFVIIVLGLIFLL